MKVIILLATYNGQAYLRQQLQSILMQDFNEIKILVHDDGSQDETMEILKNFQSDYPDMLNIIEESPKGGASANFSFIAEVALKLYGDDDTYYMFSDQDDVWDLDKVSKNLKHMLLHENFYGTAYPLLIHTDLRVIDETGNLISESFFEYQNLDYRWGDQFSKLLTQNIVTGCTVMVNRGLLNLGLPIPGESVMHDWWLALVACAYGKIVFIPEATMCYRQHGFNEVGAKKFDLSYVLRKAISFWDSDNRMQSLNDCVNQAHAFSRTHAHIPEGDLAAKFSHLQSCGFVKKRQIIFYNKFYKIGWQRQLAWILLN